MAAPILTEAATINGTTLFVGDTSELEPDSVIVIDSEQMIVREIKSDRIDVRRGVLGSVKATHAVAAAITTEFDLFRSSTKREINLAAATQALTADMTGQKFIAAADAVFTLPSAAAANMIGVWYEFECGDIGGATGVSIDPNAADAIGGNSFTVVVNKDLINTAATDRLGDMVRIYCTGVAGATAWRVEEILGTWAKEP